jgi:hypothetical protein
MVHATSDVADDGLAALSVGQRDAHLLGLRAAMFGERLDGWAACPRCGERLEFSLGVSDLRPADDLAAGEPIIVEQEGLRVAVRPPDSRDLAAIAGAGTLDAARQLLLQRCVTVQHNGDGSDDVAHLPPAVLDRISATLSRREAQADVSLALRCVACAHEWQLLFDIGAFLWSEIEACAGRLLGEVDALARAYGWRESDILALSGARRAAYLDMVT